MTDVASILACYRSGQISEAEMVEICREWPEVEQALKGTERSALVSRLRDDELITINTVNAAADQIEADGRRIEKLEATIREITGT
jgi:hypothetical protein